ncbi:acyl-CoA N-acyltransferase [Amylocarpus encephaloides]|uniref:Acyl-CoA N-acyltransferase n=1 Tax=Amylocarpus encephaloides TaxID=45428 RepID=A0A9P8C4T3_9HELO|nr:acyl-CoA N-acyltransferase [Amylocarpus encephaloides]
MADQWDNFQFALPHPYNTAYRIYRSADADAALSAFFKIELLKEQPAANLESPQVASNPLHNSDIIFSHLLKGENISVDDNTSWARARRSQSVAVKWRATEAPTLSQIWLIVYASFSLSPEHESFRLQLVGANKNALQQDLISVGLGTRHPSTAKKEPSDDLIIIRGTFWQGAGSPFGSRPPWLADQVALKSSKEVLSSYPLMPLTYTQTNKFPTSRVYAHHPVRPTKPTAGSAIYSRYIPHLQEHFSMVALDYENPEHLNLFHTWQNDPRVAQGWNETGTVEQHRTYLKNLHDDPHILTMLARFEDVFFAYFEVYWAKEDTLGAYYDAGDFDRGRHSLVGDIRYRGPHRVSAWWSSLMHYIFLDDPRTTCVVGEPRATNTRVLAYDLAHGFSVEKFVDFPHKRSAFVRCQREKFFDLCPFEWDGGRSLEEADTFYQASRGSKL